MASDNYARYASLYKWLFRQNNLYYCRLCVMSQKKNSFTQGKHSVLVEKYLKRHEVCADHVEAMGEQKGEQERSTQPPRLFPPPAGLAPAARAVSGAYATPPLPAGAHATPPLPAGCLEIAPIPEMTNSMMPTPVIELPNASVFSENPSHTVPKVIDADYLRTDDGRRMCRLLLSSRRCTKSVMDWFSEFATFLEWDVGKDLIGCKFCRQANSFGALALGKPLRQVNRCDIQVHETTNNHRLVFHYFQKHRFRPAAGDRIGMDSSTSRDLVVVPDREYLGQNNRQVLQEAQFSAQTKDLTFPPQSTHSGPHAGEPPPNIPQIINGEVLRDNRIAPRLESMLASRFGRARVFFELFADFPWLELDMATANYHCRFCRQIPDAYDGVMTRGKPVDRTKRGDLVVHEQTYSHNQVMKHYGKHDMVWRKVSNGPTNMGAPPAVNHPNHGGVPLPLLPELQHMCEQFTPNPPPEPNMPGAQSFDGKYPNSQSADGKFPDSEPNTKKSQSVVSDTAQQSEGKRRKEKPLHIGIEDSILCDSPSPVSEIELQNEESMSNTEIGSHRRSSASHHTGEKSSEKQSKEADKFHSVHQGKSLRNEAHPKQSKDEQSIKENTNIDTGNAQTKNRCKDARDKQKGKCQDIMTSDDVVKDKGRVTVQEKEAATDREHSDGESTSPSTPKSDCKSDSAQTSQTESFLKYLSNKNASEMSAKSHQVTEYSFRNAQKESEEGQSNSITHSDVFPKQSRLGESRGLGSSEMLLSSCELESDLTDTNLHAKQTYRESFWHTANVFRRQRGLCDVTFYLIYPSGGRATFQAHKLILACASDFWRAKFEDDPNGNFVIESSNISADGMEGLMNFLYGQNIQGGADYLKACYKAAKFLNIPYALRAFKALLELKCPKLEFLNTTLDVKVATESDQSDEDNSTADESTGGRNRSAPKGSPESRSWGARDSVASCTGGRNSAGKRKHSSEYEPANAMASLKRRPSDQSGQAVANRNASVIQQKKGSSGNDLPTASCSVRAEGNASSASELQVNAQCETLPGKRTDENGLDPVNPDDQSGTESAAKKQSPTIVGYTFSRKSTDTENVTELGMDSQPLAETRTDGNSCPVPVPKTGLIRGRVVKRRKCYICKKLRCISTPKRCAKFNFETALGVPSNFTVKVSRKVTLFKCKVCQQHLSRKRESKYTKRWGVKRGEGKAAKKKVTC